MHLTLPKELGRRSVLRRKKSEIAVAADGMHIFLHHIVFGNRVHELRRRCVGLVVATLVKWDARKIDIKTEIAIHNLEYTTRASVNLSLSVVCSAVKGAFVLDCMGFFYQSSSWHSVALLTSAMQVRYSGVFSVVKVGISDDASRYWPRGLTQVDFRLFFSESENHLT